MIEDKTSGRQVEQVSARQLIDDAVSKVVAKVAKKGITAGQILDLLHGGHTMNEIADKLGFSKAVLQVIRAPRQLA